jgi:hypothetical protein
MIYKIFTPIMIAGIILQIGAYGDTLSTGEGSFMTTGNPDDVGI